jgi:tetrahydromethanopterin S-methyltransferase subunit E
MSSVAEKLAKKSSRAASAKQVRLKLVYIDFWSALKLSFLISVVLGIVLVVVVFLVWSVIASTGIFESVSQLFQDVAGEGSDFRLDSIVGLPQVMGFSIIVALLNVVVLTALGAIAALLYNLSVRITGGLLVGFTNN